MNFRGAGTQEKKSVYSPKCLSSEYLKTLWQKWNAQYLKPHETKCVVVLYAWKSKKNTFLTLPNTHIHFLDSCFPHESTTTVDLPHFVDSASLKSNDWQQDSPRRLATGIFYHKRGAKVFCSWIKKGVIPCSIASSTMKQRPFFSPECSPLVRERFSLKYLSDWHFNLSNLQRCIMACKWKKRFLIWHWGKPCQVEL